MARGLAFVFIAIFSVFVMGAAPSGYAANQIYAYLSPQYSKGSEIPGLKLSAGEIPVEGQYVILRGQFENSAAHLAINGQLLRTNNGGFEVRMKIAAAQTKVIIQALNSDGKVVSSQKWVIEIVSRQQAQNRRLQLLRFRLSEITVFQSIGNSFSGELSWNPTFHLARTFSLSGNLGVTGFKNRYGSDIVVLEAQALGALGLGSFHIEAGAGPQIWTDTNSAYLALSGNVLYQLSSSSRKVTDSLFLGFTSVLIPNYPTQELKVGVQATW